MDQDQLDALIILGGEGTDCSLLQDNMASTKDERQTALEVLATWARTTLNKRYGELIIRQVEANRRKASTPTENVVDAEIPAN